jgi:hypothetical protein
MIPGKGSNLMNHHTKSVLQRVFLLIMWCIMNVGAQLSPEDEEKAFYEEKGYMLLYGKQYGDYPSNVYLVTDDVIVEKGQTLTLYPGTVVLFKKNTRIDVHGSLICQGKRDGSIILKKLDNKDYFYTLETDMPTWWHGITAAESASVEISYSYIQQSKFGIEADKACRSIILDTVKFSDNRYQNLKIGDMAIAIPDEKFFCFNSETKPFKVSLGLEKQKPVKEKRPRTWKTPARIIFSSIALGGAAALAVFEYRALDYKDQYNNSGFTPETDRLREKTEENILGRNIAFVVTAVGAVGFGITIPFGK